MGRRSHHSSSRSRSPTRRPRDTRHADRRKDSNGDQYTTKREHVADDEGDRHRQHRDRHSRHSDKRSESKRHKERRSIGRSISPDRSRRQHDRKAVEDQSTDRHSSQRRKASPGREGHHSSRHRQSDEAANGRDLAPAVQPSKRQRRQGDNASREHDVEQIASVREHPAEQMQLLPAQSPQQQQQQQKELSSSHPAEQLLVQDEEEPNAEPEPDFALTGKLAADSNKVNGVVLLHNEPAEAANPEARWRLYQFKKGAPFQDPLPIHRQSMYLFGRERRCADVPTDHPSCSKQHAVLQFRCAMKQGKWRIEKEGTDGMPAQVVRPYVMDLGSVNGTFINSERIESERYYELLEQDMIKFGNSTREYVLLREDMI